VTADVSLVHVRNGHLLEMRTRMRASCADVSRSRKLLRRLDRDLGRKRFADAAAFLCADLGKTDGTYVICDSTTPTISSGSVGIGTTAPQSLLEAYNGEVQIGSSGNSCAAANNGALRYHSGSV
jgi:hypothetical protein